MQLAITLVAPDPAVLPAAQERVELVLPDAGGQVRASRLLGPGALDLEIASDLTLSVAEVAGPAEEQHPEPAEGVEVSLRWLHRGPIEPGTDQLLVPALEQLELPDGRGHAYLTGELRVVAAMRKALEARGLTAEQLSPKPYWRRGVANAAHGEPLKD